MKLLDEFKLDLLESERRRQEDERRQWNNPASIDGVKLLGWLMILAGVLVGIAGLTGFSYFSGKFQHQYAPWEVSLQGAGFMVVGVLLLVAFRNKKKKRGSNSVVEGTGASRTTPQSPHR
jgi:membrane protein implicated in regulation of membrane protease activity